MHREGHIGAALVGYAPIGGILVAVGINTLAVALAYVVGATVSGVIATLG